MSRNAELIFDWADGTYTFRLPIGLLAELQDKCNAGPPLIYARIEANMYAAVDLIETIRLGLIGGGMKSDEAKKLVRRYVEDRPLWESVEPAQRILEAAIAGPEDEPLKKEPGAEMTETRSQTEKSDSPPITAAAL